MMSQREPKLLFRYSKKRWHYQYTSRSHIFVKIWNIQKTMLLFAHVVKMIGEKKEASIDMPGDWYTYKIFYSTVHHGIFIELHVWDVQVTSIKMYITKKMLLRQCKYFAKYMPEKSENMDKLREYIKKYISNNLWKHKKMLQKKQ